MPEHSPATRLVASLGLLASVAILSGPVAAYSGGQMGRSGAMGGFGAGPLLWLLVVAGIVVVVAGVARSGTTGREPDRREDRALSTLRERYASGELSREEFERRRRTLTRE